MTDTLTPGKRSWNMGRIRDKNTKPEKTVRSALHRMGLRFSLHRKDLPGKPDIVGLTLFAFRVCHLFNHLIRPRRTGQMFPLHGGHLDTLYKVCLCICGNVEIFQSAGKGQICSAQNGQIVQSETPRGKPRGTLLLLS